MEKEQAGKSDAMAKRAERFSKIAERRSRSGYSFQKLDARVLFIAFVAIIVILILTTLGFRGGGEGLFAEKGENLRVSARSLPTDGTFPGGSAAVRVTVSNSGDQDASEVVVEVTLPARSGLKIRGGEFSYESIAVMNPGDTRELFFPIDVSNETLEGTYTIKVKARTADEAVVEETSTKLEIKIGSRARCYGEQCEAPPEWL